MRLDRNIYFAGALGEHTDNNEKPCTGRHFKPIMVGVGGVYTNQVCCPKCGRELEAYEDRLAAA